MAPLLVFLQGNTNTGTRNWRQDKSNINLLLCFQNNCRFKIYYAWDSTADWIITNYKIHQKPYICIHQYMFADYKNSPATIHLHTSTPCLFTKTSPAAIKCKQFQWEFLSMAIGGNMKEHAHARNSRISFHLHTHFAKNVISTRKHKGMIHSTLLIFIFMMCIYLCH
jgi:hypothetical protein